jgi:predicted esterase YcpF (UPF0227 family)
MFDKERIETMCLYMNIYEMSDQERAQLWQDWKDGVFDYEESIRTYRVLRQCEREFRQQAIRDRKVLEIMPYPV